MFIILILDVILNIQRIAYKTRMAMKTNRYEILLFTVRLLSQHLYNLVLRIKLQDLNFLVR